MSSCWSVIPISLFLFLRYYILQIEHIGILVHILCLTPFFILKSSSPTQSSVTIIFDLIMLIDLDKNFLAEPSDLLVHLGDMAMLPCSIEAIPRVSVQWYKDDLEIAADNADYLVHSSDGVLEIRSVQFMHFGRYKCRATNTDKSKYSASAVIIQNTDIGALWLLIGIASM